MNLRQLLSISLLVALGAASPAIADSDTKPSPPPPAAAALLKKARDSRPTFDLSLKARLFVNRTENVPVEMLVHRQGDGVATVFRGPDLELLIVQSDDGTTRYYRQGVGELAGAAVFEPLFGSHFTPHDLSAPFLYWPDPEYLRDERHRGRTCHVVEAVSPDPQARFPRAQLWLDREFGGLLRVDEFNPDGDLVRQLAITSFRKVDRTWIPRGLEIVFRPPGQALPAAEKSRLEVHHGDDDAQLDPALFDPSRFE